MFEILKHLIPKPFKFATSVMNVDIKWQYTFEIYCNIPNSKQFFILVSYWLVFTFLVSYWSALTFFITNMDSKKYANISLNYPHHEGA